MSLGVLLFVPVFVYAVAGNRIEPDSDFLIAKIQNTKKQSAAINFEEIVKNELYSKNIEPVTLNTQINNSIVKHLKETENEDWYILDIKTNNKSRVRFEELQVISKVIVLRPAPNIYVKRYTITNGINKNKFLCFDVLTSFNKSHFSFPKNYGIEVIVYT